MEKNYLNAEEWMKKNRERSFDYLLVATPEDIQKVAQREGWDPMHNVRAEPNDQPRELHIR